MASMMVSCTVFSAHAEVVPMQPQTYTSGQGILRARGGSSDKVSLQVDDE